MAKIQEEYIIVKVSKLVADDTPMVSALTSELKDAIGEAAKELVSALVGDHVIVEVADGE